MAGYIQIVTKSWRPILESLRDDLNARKDKDFFPATGTQVYVGAQGQGKTVSAVTHIRKVKAAYPKSILVSNVDLKYMKACKFDSKEKLHFILERMNPKIHYILFQDMEQLGIALTEVNNEKFGVIYLIDEIHTYFNSLQSDKIPMYIFTEISQQRKQRKVIVGTSQIFTRMAKPFREQCDHVIFCRTIMGFLTLQRAFDGMTLEVDNNGKLTGNKKRTGWFFHTRVIRGSFDTYQKVVSGAEQYAMEQSINIVSKKGKISIK